MELWQMDIVGGVRVVNGSESKIVSGIDDQDFYRGGARIEPVYRALQSSAYGRRRTPTDKKCWSPRRVEHQPSRGECQRSRHTRAMEHVSQPQARATSRR
jgi:hypothetical protein